MNEKTRKARTIKDSLTVAATAAPVAPTVAVTPYNVGQWCMSEDECRSAGIDFGAYERGVADAAEAFARNAAHTATAPQPVSEPAARWVGDDAIESPHNACQHRGYCLSLKAAPRAPLTDELLAAAKSAITCSYADHGRRSVNAQAWDRLMQAIAAVAHGIGQGDA